MREVQQERGHNGRKQLQRLTEKRSFKKERGKKGQEGEEGISQKCQLPLCKIPRGEKKEGWVKGRGRGLKEKRKSGC